MGGGLVVAGQPVNTRLDKNEAELGVAVLAVPVEVLTDGNGFLNEHVQIFGELGGEAVGLKDAHNFVPRHGLDLCHALGITKVDADLGRDHALLRQLANLVTDLRRADLQP